MNKPRKANANIVLPICYGSVSTHLGKKGSNDYHSHRRTRYLRCADPAANLDLSPVISRVEFKLHPSFKHPNRSIEKPPFEVTETGWGEFELGITVHFHEDTGEPPVELTHALKLYQEGQSQASQNSTDARKPVVSEKYDEIGTGDRHNSASATRTRVFA